MLKDQDVLVKLESDRYYILASSSYADDRTRVLNTGNTFAIFDRWGDAKQIGTKVQGIYHEGTRFISDLEFRINGYRPVLLSSNVKEENEILSIDLANPRMDLDGGKNIEKGLLHISRSKFLLEGICYETIVIQNFDIEPHELECSLYFEGDFNDIFEVRGIERLHRGQVHHPETVNDSELKFTYKGLDDIARTSWVRFENKVEWIKSNLVIFQVSLEPGERYEIKYSIQCVVGTKRDAPPDHTTALMNISKTLKEGKKKIAEIYTSNEQFTQWVDRSKFDLLSLLTPTEHGLYPYAGVPWYNTPFGRDGIITAMECLWIAPEISKGVLLYLAASQAREADPFRDAEPGKILHEARGGEMVELNEIPFKQYYGTIDATPLFIVLAGYYYKRTADLETIKNIWENIEQAIHWIEEYGDIDKDGFVEYKQKMESGLANQGWKDSHDSVSHENGMLAEPPIALCEVQGYVYDAYLQAAYLADAVGDDEKALGYHQKAKELKKRFNEAFWDEEMEFYVLALDGEKNPCRVKTSNAGQCLFSEIADKKHAEKLVRNLLKDDMFSGWGVRTLSSEAKRYNPMSYHNGSVWPHDTAMVAYGMARYGYVEESMRLMQGMFEACLFIDLQRLPELFCGFPFRRGEAPTSYPVACVPQAWSVAAVFLLLQGCLRICVNAPQKRLEFNKPQLPSYLDQVIVRNIYVPGGKFDLEFQKYQWDIGIHVLSKPDDWEIIVYR